MVVQCRITHSITLAILSASTPSYTKLERGTVRVKCVSLEDNTVTLLEPGLLNPESSFNYRCGFLVGFEPYQSSHYTR